MTRPRKSKKGTVRVTSVSLTPEAAEKLEAFCKKHERSKSWAVDKLIIRYLEKLQ